MPTLITAGDASNGVVVTSANDNALTIQTGAAGAKVNAAAFASDGTLTLAKPMAGGSLTLGTAQATTSGTSIDFTGIPSWVKRITIGFVDVTINGVTQLMVQLGTSSGVETTGYAATGSAIQGTSVGATGSTTNFPLSNSDGGATWLRRGQAVVTLMGSNTWVISSSLSVTGAASDRCEFGAGKKALAGQLDRLRIGSFNGTSVLTAGSVNILYEG